MPFFHGLVMPHRQQLRQQLRSMRRGLSQQEQRSHSLRLARLLRTFVAYRKARRLAFYFSADGEMDPSPLMELARRDGKRCYLPVLRRLPRVGLWFVEYSRSTQLRRNHFGIPEPVSARTGQRVPPWGLNIIFMPLVAFDARCNRLGMGGGYYDRALAYRRHRRRWLGPKLIGLAHECQKLDRLSPRPWDIPLNGVCTENKLYRRLE